MIHWLRNRRERMVLSAIDTIDTKEVNGIMQEISAANQEITSLTKLRTWIQSLAQKERLLAQLQNDPRAIMDGKDEKLAKEIDAEVTQFFEVVKKLHDQRPSQLTKRMMNQAKSLKQLVDWVLGREEFQKTIIRRSLYGKP